MTEDNEEEFKRIQELESTNLATEESRVAVIETKKKIEKDEAIYEFSG